MLNSLKSLQIWWSAFGLRFGTYGDDLLVGGAGRDLLFGRAGNNSLAGLARSDRLFGGNGNDVLDGGGGNDALSGGRGNDLLIGGIGNDSLDGGDGQDLLDAGKGSDQVRGGTGDDVAIYRMTENAGYRDEYDGGTGRDALSLEFTRAQWMNTIVQSDVARLVSQLDRPSLRPGSDTFGFNAFGLKLKSFERVEIVVDGVAVTAKDDPVDAVNDTYTVAANGSFPGRVLANDSVPDLVRSVSLVAAPAKGKLVLNADGSFTFNTNGAFANLGPHQSTSVTFKYKVTDADFDSDTATVTIIVTNPNRAPVAHDDAITVAEDGGVTTFAVLGNDTDPDGDALRVTGIATEPTHGVVAINPAGTLTYTPDADFFGNDFIDYTISDGFGGTATARVAVTVTPVNDAPVAVDDLLTVAEDSGAAVVSVLGNDIDRDGDVLQVSAIAQGPAHGAVTINPGGTLSYTPDADFAGDDMFVYRVSDGHGGDATAQVRVSVTPVNDAPVANDDDDPALTTTTGTALTIAGATLLGNDLDLDGDTLAIASVTNGTGGTVTLVNGDVVFTPDAGFTGDATFTYAASDGQAASEPATVTVTVGSPNNPPALDAANSDLAGTLRDSAFSDIQLSSAQGLIAWQDGDVGEIHTVSFVPRGDDYLGTFSFKALNESVNRVIWEFTFPSDELDVLSAGETFTQVYDVTLTDEGGASFTEAVTVTIIGATEHPVITGTTGLSQTIHETPEGQEMTGEVHTVSGTISYTDVDRLDTHDLIVTAGDATVTGGTFSYVVDQEANIVTWTFSIADNLIEGEVGGGWVRYNVRLRDNDEGRAPLGDPLLIDIDIANANDLPEFKANTSDMAGELSEGGVLSTTGHMDWTDPDGFVAQNYSVSFAPRETGYVGTFSVLSRSGGTQPWQFSVQDGVLDDLAAGEQVTQLYDVTLRDDGVVAFTQTVTITLTGTVDDLPLV